MKLSEVTIEELEDGSIRISFDGVAHLLNPVDGQIPDEVIREHAARVQREAMRRRQNRELRDLEAIEAWASRRKSATAEGQRPEPPRLAEAAFALLAPRATVDSQLGDLQEIFSNNVQRYGSRRARWLYWLEVVRAIAPAMFRLAKRIGFIGLIIDYCRARLGL
jgi:hypothetical protein